MLPASKVATAARSVLQAGCPPAKPLALSSATPMDVQGRRNAARRLKKQASWLSIQRRTALREAAFQKLPPGAAADE